MTDRNLRYDILKELFNMSVGRAASLLSEITNRRILLNVPDVVFVDLNKTGFNTNEYIPKTKDGTLMASSISFEKNMTGKANLIFPAEKMRTFINLCINNDEQVDTDETNFTDVDFDVIKEIGNIILNSIVGEVGNYLNIELNYSLPEVKIFNLKEFEKDIGNTEFKHILVLYITFIIDDAEIEGAILVDFSLKSLNTLISKIDQLGEGLYE